MSVLIRRGLSPALLGTLVVVLFVVTLSLVGSPARPAASAQEATPQATPLATPLPTGGVPCTFLFGIQDPEAACVLPIHGVADAGFLDLYIDGTLAVPGLQFGILGDFVPVASGALQIQLTAAGGDPANALVDETVEFAPGVPYELAAVGPSEDVQLLTRAVNTEPFAPGTARIAVVNGAADASALDLVAIDGTVLAEDVSYLDVSNEISLPAGVYALHVRPANEAEAIVRLGELQFSANVAYSMYIIGLIANNTIGGFVVPVAVPPPAVEAVATPVP